MKKCSRSTTALARMVECGYFTWTWALHYKLLKNCRGFLYNCWPCTLHVRFELAQGRFSNISNFRAGRGGSLYSCVRASPTGPSISHLSIYPSTFYPFIHPPTHPSINHPPIFPLIHSCVHASMYQYPSTYWLVQAYICIHPPIHASIHLSHPIRTSIDPSIIQHLSIKLRTYQNRLHQLQISRTHLHVTPLKTHTVRAMLSRCIRVRPPV